MTKINMTEIERITCCKKGKIMHANCANLKGITTNKLYSDWQRSAFKSTLFLVAKRYT